MAYPANGAKVAFDHVIFEGSVLPGATLSVNGRKLDVGPDGLFMEWLPLTPGVNDLLLSSVSGSQTSALSFRVVSAPAAPLPASPARITPGSALPDGGWIRYGVPTLALEDRRLTFAFSGSPGGKAVFWIGTQGPYSMTETGRGRYSGSYTLRPSDTFNHAPVRYLLRAPDGSRAELSAPGSVSTLPGPRYAEVTALDLGRGVNPVTAGWAPVGGDNLLYPRQGTQFAVVGENAGNFLTRLPGEPTLPLLEVTRSTSTLLPEGTPPALAVLTSATLTELSAEDTSTHLTLRLPLGARVPFTLQQQANTLELRLYGTGGDPADLNAALETAAPTDPLLQSLTWSRTPATGPLVATLTLETEQQWGYDAVYDGSDLLLSVRRPPPASADAALPLAGRRIVVDPGHGGSELGGAGALRVQEKDIMLPVAQAVAAGLRTLGATVVLTRTNDVQVPLYNRPLLAEALDADLLLSIHANALPDGSDPRGRRGVGAYWTQPQARPLAACLVGAVASELPELGVDTPDNGGLHLANLALTRPSTQLSVLVETAYLTDAGNLRTLMSDAGRARIAAALVDGVRDFYAGKCSGQ
ncbi:N-acetylmuramoyl-L-alanine amidase [Deinococcus ruber]|uniref:N-acetylmuramoyl-L-alanine amidase n=1 Tax=Deinococcus ruber TaxID=1848197 RepID=A0A918F0F2_9DEIO|nr:N-acetylmuramoyl-L-alanine amidase [Deinococcus ruber]